MAGGGGHAWLGEKGMHGWGPCMAGGEGLYMAGGGLCMAEGVLMKMS